MGSLYDLLKQRRMVRQLHRRAGRARSARADRRDRPARAERGLQPGAAAARRRRPRVLARSRRSPTTKRSRLRGVVRDAAAQVFVLTRERRLPRPLHERRQARRTADEIEWPVPFWHVDAGAAMMLVLLAAIEEGLGGGRLRSPGETRREACASCWGSRTTSRSSPASPSVTRPRIPTGTAPRASSRSAGARTTRSCSGTLGFGFVTRFASH